MKKIFMPLLLCVIPMAIAKGEPDKLSHRGMMLFELKTILEKDAIKSQISGDGNLSFEIKGNSYLLEVTEDSSSLYYARLSRFYRYESSVTSDAIDLFNKEINFRTIKVLNAKEGYYLRSEFIFKDSQYFKVIYHRLIELIDKTHKTVLDKCPELGKRNEDGALTITNLKLLTERTDSTVKIYPVVTFSVDQNSEYSVFIRLYRNNTLMQNDVSPVDYSSVDTLRTINQGHPFMMKHWADCMADSISYRCELWYNENCIATSSYNTK